MHWGNSIFSAFYSIFCFSFSIKQWATHKGKTQHNDSWSNTSVWSERVLHFQCPFQVKYNTFPRVECHQIISFLSVSILPNYIDFLHFHVAETTEKVCNCHCTALLAIVICTWPQKTAKINKNWLFITKPVWNFCNFFTDNLRMKNWKWLWQNKHSQLDSVVRV